MITVAIIKAKKRDDGINKKEKKNDNSRRKKMEIANIINFKDNFLL
ncbi:MAG: hypothetical protein P1P85_02815 [Patescibacteria group bacterium]|nr:hypothetical protein [Patescibacteria group bacterium]